MDVQELTEIGGYRVVRLIAEGGMSWVFEVVDPRFDVHRALKLLKPQAAVGREFERFTAEAQVLARLEHPNVITIYDFGRDEQTQCFYYTMSLIEGASLSELQLTSTERICEIVLDALAGLSEIHDAGIIHRDIKPGNILVSQQGRAYIADLGIARVDAGDAGMTRTAEELTRTGMMVGTLLYSSPEQTRGQAVAKSSDIFSMGLTLYKVITGESVYDKVEELESTSGQEVMMYLGSLVHSGTELALTFPKAIPTPIRKVIVQACSMNPERRYQDAREMYDALCDALDRAYPEDGVQSGRWPKVLAAAALVLALGAGAAWWGTRDAAEPEPPSEPVAEVEPMPPDEPETIAMATLEGSESDVRIQALLMRAKEQLAVNRLTMPAGDNALESYRTVQTIDPDNADAAAGLEEIRSRQVALAEKAEERGDSEKAMKFYRRALLAAPGDPELERRLREAAQGIEREDEAERQLARLAAEREEYEARIAAAEQAAREAKAEAKAAEQARAGEDARAAALVSAAAAQPEQGGARAAAEREEREREAQRLEADRLASKRKVEKRDAEAKRQAKLFAVDNTKAQAAAIGMLVVEAGPFLSGPGKGTPAETRGFWIDRTEVTTRDYQKCVEEGACSAIKPHRHCNLGKTDRADHPINCANFVQAKAYCAWAEKRIPTGDEWEKAARGTQGQLHPWGDESATCRHQVMRSRGCERTASTSQVGSRPDGASPYGALDMMGNVWEWTEQPGSRNPVLRGGAWNTGPVTVDHRYPYSAKKGTPSTGFRCVR